MELSILSPLITGFVWAINNMGVPKKFSPIMSIGIGMLMALTMGQPWWQGAIAGLVSIGIWSGGKNTIETFVEK